MNGMKEAYTTQELAPLLGMTRQGVDCRAKREGWQSRPRAGRGGGREWLVDSMPESTRLAIAAKVAPFTPVPVIPSKSITIPVQATLSEGGKARVEAKTALFLLYRTFTKAAGLPKVRGREVFSAHWNAGEIEAEAWLREAIPHVSKNTLLNWERAIDAEGSARLAGDYGKGMRGKGRIDSQLEVKEIVLGMLDKYPYTTAKMILEELAAANERRVREGLEPFILPSEWRLREWLRAWKKSNPALYQLMKSPDGYNDNYNPSFGDIYAGIIRLNQRWEYDGTPSDVMLSDGNRYAIIGVIDIYSRRLKLEVGPRSNADVVSNLTRRCLLDWGVLETPVTDNGKEFVSRQMGQVFADFNVVPDILPPFRPDLKPGIERAFGVFNHDLLTLCPCYVGYNVEKRREIESRESFAKRLMKKGEDPELVVAMTPEELQEFCDNWTDKIYAHRPHTGLKGKTPYQMAAEYPGVVRRIRDERALDMLLMPLAGQDGYRTVSKKGVKADRGIFIAPELGRCIGQRVQVRISRTDKRYAYIYDEAGLFVCRAHNVADLTSEEQRTISVDARNAAQSVKAETRRLRAFAKKHNLDQAYLHIMEHHIRKAEEYEAAHPMPTQNDVDYMTFELAEAQRAASGEKSMQTLTLEEAEQARIEAVEIVADQTFMVPKSAQGRNALFLELESRAQSGEDLTGDERNWMAMYRTSSERAGFEAMNQLYAVNQ